MLLWWFFAYFLWFSLKLPRSAYNIGIDLDILWRFPNFFSWLWIISFLGIFFYIMCKKKNKVFRLFLILGFLISWLLWFSMNFKRNSFYYFNLGLYSGDCKVYGKCLKFSNKREIRDVTSRGIRNTNIRGNTFSQVQKITSLAEYNNGILLPWSEEKTDYWTVLNQSGVVLIWDEIYTNIKKWVYNEWVKVIE